MDTTFLKIFCLYLLYLIFINFTNFINFMDFINSIDFITFIDFIDFIFLLTLLKFEPVSLSFRFVFLQLIKTVKSKSNRKPRKIKRN